MVKYPASFLFLFKHLVVVVDGDQLLHNTKTSQGWFYVSPSLNLFELPCMLGGSFTELLWEDVTLSVHSRSRAEC